MDLAQRAVACKHWRWLPGMLCQPGRATTEGGRYLGEDPPGTGGHNVGFADGTAAHKVNSWLPDFGDPATLGCLLALVREAWDDPEVFCRSRPGVTKSVAPWACYTNDGGIHSGRIEAEALVAALEAAP